MKRISMFLILVLACLPLLAQQSEAVQIVTQPEKIYFSGADDKLLHFDFIISSKGKDTLNLIRIEMKAFDKAGKLISQKMTNVQGFNPGIVVVAPRGILPGKSISVMNPFYDFDSHFEPERIDYELTFGFRGQTKAVKTVTIKPSEYVSPNTWQLPLKNKMLVKDGTDFFSQHRRIDLSNPMVNMIGLKKNSQIFALDLCVIGEDDRLYKTDGKKREDWLSFGAEVVAAADGKVHEVHNEADDADIDKITFNYNGVPANPKLLLGNYVIIEHANGEYSFYTHLQKGSVVVKVGDVLKAGSKIATVGNSGDSFTPNLRFFVLDGTSFLNNNAYPIQFSNFSKWYGSKELKLKRGSVNTGEIVQGK